MTLIEEVARLRTEMIELRAMGEANRALIDRHEEQINGRRGQSVTLDALAAEIQGLRSELKADRDETRSSYDGVRKMMLRVSWVIIVAAIGFAFSALAAVGHL